MTLADDESAAYEAAFAALARGDLKQASNLCQSLLQAQPVSARGYHLMSSLFQATGNYRKAFDYAALATQMECCVAQYHLQQAHVLLALGEYEQAAESFTRAADLDASNVAALIGVGDCMKALERYPQAQAWYARAREHSTAPDVILSEAECYLQSGDDERAESLLSQHLQSYPDSAHAHYLCALHALSHGAIAKAETHLRKAQQLSPTHVMAHFYAALIRWHLGDEQGAIRSALHVLQHLPTHLPSLILLSNLFFHKGEIEAALKACSHVLALSPEHILVWQQMMQIYAGQKRLAEAQKLLKEVIDRAENPLPLKHVRALYRSDVPPFAPRDYVAAIYDRLAETFEYWLLAAADMRHVAEATACLRACEMRRDATHLSLLDIGCNTGKTAELLENITAIRVGVDVSAGMAKLARRSKRYDVVYEWDAIDFALASENKFDLVVAVGALRWMGNVQPFFNAIRNVMYSHSLCAFMVSKEPSSLAYTVSPDGRYCHNAAYIKDVMDAEGFTIVVHKDIVRFDTDAGAGGRHLFIIKKTTLH